MTLRPAIFAFFALLCVAGTVRADTPPALGQQRVYLGDGRTLTVSAPKRLTSDAHIWQFLARPDFRGVAYTAARYEADGTTEYVGLVGVQDGDIRTLLANDGPNSGTGKPFSYQLTAWSGEGRYLLVSHTEAKYADGTSPELYGRVWDSVNTGVSPVQVRRIPLFETGGEDRRIAPSMLPSPSGMLFAVTHDRLITQGKPAPLLVFIYDPAQDILRRLLLPDDTLLLGWADDAHLILLYTTGVASHAVLYDVHAHTETPTTQEPAEPILPASALPGVTLSLTQTARDLPSMGTRSTTATVALYLHVTAGKRELLPLLLGGSFLSHDTHAVLAPDQSSAVWVQNGDLYTCAFAVVPATEADKATGR